MPSFGRVNVPSSLTTKHSAPALRPSRQRMHDDADFLAFDVGLAVHALTRGVDDRGAFEAPRRRRAVGARRLHDEPAMRVVVVPLRHDTFDEPVLPRIEHRERVMRVARPRVSQRPCAAAPAARIVVFIYCASASSKIGFKDWPGSSGKSVKPRGSLYCGSPGK